MEATVVNEYIWGMLKYDSFRRTVKYEITIHPNHYQNFFKTFFVLPHKNLSLNELKLIAKSRNIKDYKNKSENNLTKTLSEPKPKINLSKNETKEIKKDFSKVRYRFSKSKINEFRSSLYNIKKPKKSFHTRNKRGRKKSS